MGWLLFLTAVIFFGGILYRRYEERRLQETIEGLAKLGMIQEIRVVSNFFVPAFLVEVILNPKTGEHNEVVKEELKVAWQSDKPEMVSLQVSPRSRFVFPKFLPAEIMGKLEWYELRPIIAEHAGIWHLARVEEEVSLRGRTRNVKRVLSTRDFLVTGEMVGVIVWKLWMGEKEKHQYFAPDQGFPISLQVSDGTEVSSGDILVIMAIPTGKPISENPN